MSKYVAEKRMKLPDRDRHWLMDVYLGVKKMNDMPQTTFRKLLDKGLIEFKLTEEGKKAAFIETLMNKL